MTELTEQSFQRLLEAAPDAILCVAGDGQIVLVNAQAERLFGYPRQELLGQPLELLVPDEARIRPAQHRPGYAARPHTRPMGVGLELAGRRRDGSVFPAEVSLAAIDTDSGLLITAAVRDVTERLAAQSERERLKTQAERDRLERQLQQSQRLNSLGELAGGVAHDFNNLLGVISSYAAFAAEDVPEQAPPECWQALRADLEQVERAAGRAAELTHQLLSFARREVAQRQVLNLHEVVAGVEQLLQRTLGEHVDLATVPGRDLSPVLADPGQIEQVLVNLAINARDAMPAGGRLTIETGNVDVDEVYAASRAELAAGRYVSLRVSDTGTGMTAQVVDRAFEPFYTTKPKGEGTGLGLASVYGIITQAGGNVRIYSEPGLGTTVVVLLPVTDQAMTGPARSRHPSEVTVRRCWWWRTSRPARGDPADSRAQRLPGDRGGRGPGRGQPGVRPRGPGGCAHHRRRDARDAGPGGRGAGARRAARGAGALHVRVPAGPARRPGRPRIRGEPYREAVLRDHSAGRAAHRSRRPPVTPPRAPAADPAGGPQIALGIAGYRHRPPPACAGQ